eukprot:472411_1
MNKPGGLFSKAPLANQNGDLNFRSPGPHRSRSVFVGTPPSQVRLSRLSQDITGVANSPGFFSTTSAPAVANSPISLPLSFKNDAPYARSDNFAACQSPSSVPHRIPADRLSLIIDDKEKEVRDLHEWRLKKTLEEKQELEQCLDSYKQQHTRMKDDFTYNLKLLSERDEELEKYDKMFAEYGALFKEETDKLRAKVGDLESRSLAERTRFDESERKWNARLNEYAEQVRAAASRVHEESSQKLHSQYKNSLRSREKELLAEMQELMDKYEQLLQKNASESESALRAAQDTIGGRDRDLESALLRVRQLEKERVNDVALLEGQMKNLKDEKTSALNDYEKRISELTGSLKSLERLCDSERTKYKQKTNELKSQIDSVSKERDRIKPKLRSYEKEMANLRSELENSKNNVKQLEVLYEQKLSETLNEAARESKRAILSAEQQANDLKKQLWQLESEAASIRSSNSALQQTLSQRDAERRELKKSLSDAAAQLETERRKSRTTRLEHERDLQKEKSDFQSQNESRIQSLTSERERLLKDLSSCRAENEDLSQKLRSVRLNSSFDDNTNIISEENHALKSRMAQLKPADISSLSITNNAQPDTNRFHLSWEEPRSRAEGTSAFDDRANSVSGLNEGSSLRKMFNDSEGNSLTAGFSKFTDRPTSERLLSNNLFPSQTARERPRNMANFASPPNDILSVPISARIPTPPPSPPRSPAVGAPRQNEQKEFDVKMAEIQKRFVQLSDQQKELDRNRHPVKSLVSSPSTKLQSTASSTTLNYRYQPSALFKSTLSRQTQSFSQPGATASNDRSQNVLSRLESTTSKDLFNKNILSQPVSLSNASNRLDTISESRSDTSKFLSQPVSTTSHRLNSLTVPQSNTSTFLSDSLDKLQSNPSKAQLRPRLTLRSDQPPSHFKYKRNSSKQPLSSVAAGVSSLDRDKRDRHSDPFKRPDRRRHSSGSSSLGLEDFLNGVGDGQTDTGNHVQFLSSTDIPGTQPGSISNLNHNSNPLLTTKPSLTDGLDFM